MPCGTTPRVGTSRWATSAGTWKAPDFTRVRAERRNRPFPESPGTGGLHTDRCARIDRPRFGWHGRTHAGEGDLPDAHRAPIPRGIVRGIDAVGCHAGAFVLGVDDHAVADVDGGMRNPRPVGVLEEDQIARLPIAVIDEGARRIRLRFYRMGDPDP